MPAKGIDPDDLFIRRLAEEPALSEEWERTALARAVAIALVRYRTEHDLSQRELAQKLGMPQSDIARLEVGERNPSLRTLQRLAKGLGRRFTVSLAPPEQEGDLPLPAGAEVLADITLADGSRLLAAVG